MRGTVADSDFRPLWNVGWHRFEVDQQVSEAAQVRRFERWHHIKIIRCDLGAVDRNTTRGSGIGAVSLCGPGIRLDDTDLDRMAPNVRAAARDLSRSLARVSA